MAAPTHISALMEKSGAALVYQTPYVRQLKRGVQFARLNAALVPSFMYMLASDFVVNDYIMWTGTAVASLLPQIFVSFMCARMPTLVYLLPRSRPGPNLSEPQLIFYRLNPWSLRLQNYRPLHVRASEIIIERHRKYVLASWKDGRTSSKISLELDQLRGSIPDLERWINYRGAKEWGQMGFWEAFRSRLALMSGLGREEHKRVGHAGVPSPRKLERSKVDDERFSRLK